MVNFYTSDKFNERNLLDISKFKYELELAIAAGMTWDINQNRSITALFKRIEFIDSTTIRGTSDNEKLNVYDKQLNTVLEAIKEVQSKSGKEKSYKIYESTAEFFKEKIELIEGNQKLVQARLQKSRGEKPVAPTKSEKVIRQQASLQTETKPERPEKAEKPAHFKPDEYKKDKKTGITKPLPSIPQSTQSKPKDEEEQALDEFIKNKPEELKSAADEAAKKAQDSKELRELRQKKPAHFKPKT